MGRGELLPFPPKSCPAHPCVRRGSYKYQGPGPPIPMTLALLGAWLCASWAPGQAALLQEGQRSSLSPVGKEQLTVFGVWHMLPSQPWALTQAPAAPHSVSSAHQEARQEARHSVITSMGQRAQAGLQVEFGPCPESQWAGRRGSTCSLILHGLSFLAVRQPAGGPLLDTQILVKVTQLLELSWGHYRHP